MLSTLTTAALFALTYSTPSLASVQTKSDGLPSGMSFSFGVPESSISSGSGNIYFQITAPTSYSWVALGTGTKMSDSNMFVMYSDGSGNVTMSPRTATGHTMPVEDTSSTAAKLTVLAGSGVDGSTMKANIMCSNCNSWANGGQMSLSSTSSSWIAAWESGSSLDTTDKNAAIQRHDSTTGFTLDLTSASVSNDVNPFVESSNDGTSDSGGNDSNNDGGNSGSSNGGSSSGFGASTGPGDTQRILAAHGILMSILFVILFPFGSLIMPVIGKWMVHAVWQTVTFLLMWVGFALGVVLAQRMQYNFNVAHTKCGLAVAIMMVIQPVLGYLHHLHYVKYQKRGPISYAHIIYGRILIILGVITGGLGLQLANASHDLIVAYSVVSAAVFVIYSFTKGCTSMRKRRANRRGCGPRGHKLSGRKNEYPQHENGLEVESPRRPYGPSSRGGPGRY